MSLSKLYKELQRRNVVKAAISYAVSSWVILQVGQLLFPLINLPESALRIILIILIIFFPVWLVFAWVYEYTPKGFKKAEEVEEEESISQATGQRLNRIIIGGLVVVVLLLLVDRVFNVSNRMLESRGDLSIAVLPFENKGSDEDAYFADGISEDIQTQLGKIGALSVISRLTLKNYDLTGKTPSQIGEELKVSYLLTGSVRRDGDELRIGCQLINTQDDTEAWSENYDRVMEDVFQIQSEVARNIANKLEAALSPEEKKRIEKAPTDNLIAYNYYLKGREAYNQYTIESMEKAIDLFKQSIAEDQSFALAWAGLADAYAQAAYRGNKLSSAYYDTALVTAQKAINLDSEAAEGWKAQGVAYALKGDINKSIEANLRAIEKNPNHDGAISNLAYNYRNQGRYVEAIEMYSRSVELSPFSAIDYNNLGISYNLLGLYDKAIAYYQTAIKLNQDYPAPVLNSSVSYLYQGDYERAAEALEKALQLVPNNILYLETASDLALVFDTARTVGYLEELVALDYDPMENYRVSEIQAYLLMSQGDSTKAKAIVNQKLSLLLEDIEPGSENSGMALAVAKIYGILGDQDECIRWIEKAVQAGFLIYKHFELYPYYESVREDSRFQEILQNMKEEVAKMREQVLAMEVKG
ncbi:MAG: tetratricopeptide repeat protein [Bacteroidota bacterium]